MALLPSVYKDGGSQYYDGTKLYEFSLSIIWAIDDSRLDHLWFQAGP